MAAKKSTKKAAKKTAKKSGKTSHVGEPTAPELVGSEASYLRFLTEAKTLEARDVIPFRIDPVLAAHNVRRGVEVLLEHKDAGKKALPQADWTRLAELPELALGLVFASTQVDRKPEKTQIPSLLKDARRLRSLLLASAETLALAGLVPEKEVAKIRTGRGPIDTASDCVALSSLFTKHAAARAKTPVTSADTKRASELGTELLGLLRPMTSKGTKNESATLKSSLDARDRLFTLLVRGHDELWRAGAYLLGREVDQRIPALQSRYVAPRKPAPATPAEPGATGGAK